MASQYTVKKGDTLGAIAKKMGTSTSNLTGFRSGNKNLIYPGEKISIKSSPNDESTSRTETIRAELSDKTKEPQDTSNNFDRDSLNARLSNQRESREKARANLEGFRSRRYEELTEEKGLDNNRDEISALDQTITQKKNERDQAINKIRNNPGASAATLTGETSRASQLLNQEINNLTGQRNNLANDYNTTLSEIDTLLGNEVADLQSELDFYTAGEEDTNRLLQSFQQQMIQELRREEDREFQEEDNLTQFQQALELAQQRTSSQASNNQIITDLLGRLVRVNKETGETEVIYEPEFGEEKELNWFQKLFN